MTTDFTICSGSTIQTKVDGGLVRAFNLGLVVVSPNILPVTPESSFGDDKTYPASATRALDRYGRQNGIELDSPDNAVEVIRDCVWGEKDFPAETNTRLFRYIRANSDLSDDALRHNIAHIVTYEISGAIGFFFYEASTIEGLAKSSGIFSGVSNVVACILERSRQSKEQTEQHLASRGGFALGHK